MNYPNSGLDLTAIAHRTMIEAGFQPDLPPAVLAELRTLDPKTVQLPVTRDLRGLLWSSIDDRKSRDLDQVEYAEALPNGDVRVLVGIADVDALVRKGSAIDSLAAQNCTSVYTGVRTFPMLPEALSTDLTSLANGADRAAIVTELIVDNEGNVKSFDVYPAMVHNYAKLSYEAVGDWLDSHTSVPPEVTAVPKLEDQIRLQLAAAERLRQLRTQHGALEFETIQASPVINDAGQITDFTADQRNSARNLIENFMIAANVAMAQFLEAKGTPSIRRVVRTPKYWDRIIQVARELGTELPSQPDSRALATFLAQRKTADPQHYPDLSLSIVKLLGPGEYIMQKSPAGASSEDSGHFGLAVHDYTHSTAPNRRYADLITQRLVKAAISKAPTPYTEAELTDIAARCTEREDAARKVERKMRKVGAAVLLQKRIGEEFDAIVTGVTPKGTFARLLKPPVDGRIMRGERGLRVGEKVRVRLLSTEPERGFIDFGRA